MLQTLCDSVRVHYFQLAMIVQFYIHNYATGSYEVCMYSTIYTGTLNNGLVAVTNSIFTLEQVLVYHQPQPRQPVGFG